MDSAYISRKLMIMNIGSANSKVVVLILYNRLNLAVQSLKDFIGKYQIDLDWMLKIRRGTRL